MNDRWEYKVARNTAEKDAKKIKCGVTPGTLKGLVIYFPPGCQCRARCRINLGERPIAPRSPSNYHAGDGMSIVLTDINEPIKYDMPVLNWYVWNLDTAWPHTLWLSAEWISVEEAYDKSMVNILRDFVDIMKKLIGV